MCNNHYVVFASPENPSVSWCSKMVSKNTKLTVAIVVLIILILALILLAYTANTAPGVYVNWTKATTSARKYPKLLRPFEVEKWKKRVLMCRGLPMGKSHKGGELVTIGNGSYLRSGDREKWLKNALFDNKALWELYRPLYEKVARCISEELSSPVTYMRDDYPLPGFHIFSDKGWLASGWSVAKIHVDLQYKQHDWGDLDIDTNKTLSFTLPLSLPDGAGLYFLDMYLGDSTHLLTYRNAKKEKVEYELGTLYMHNGHQYHMISAYSKGVPRITLQGHAIYSKKLSKYILYW